MSASCTYSVHTLAQGGGTWGTLPGVSPHLCRHRPGKSPRFAGGRAGHSDNPVVFQLNWGLWVIAFTLGHKDIVEYHCPVAGGRQARWARPEGSRSLQLASASCSAGRAPPASSVGGRQDGALDLPPVSQADPKSRF